MERFASFMLHFTVMDNALYYRLALTMVPGITAKIAAELVTYFGDAEAAFKTSADTFEELGLNELLIQHIQSFLPNPAVEKEMAFLEKQQIKTLFIKDKDYPQRLQHIDDPPLLLFSKGPANLNAKRIISIVGTRNNTEYGKQVTEKIIRELPDEDLLIISGLALGLDGIAHRAALANGIPTLGVLAHGLNEIYPSQHRALAKEMCIQGGLLTDFRNNTAPNKYHFPRRNRIVAGMADATIVIESGEKGGSLITADLAIGYNRSVFAVPGRITDQKSVGCNKLIRYSRAYSYINTVDFLREMKWWDEAIGLVKQQELFYEPNTIEATLLALLQEKSIMSIDELQLKSALKNAEMANALLALEMQFLVRSLPGNRYTLRI
jgi:DNA processing protein